MALGILAKCVGSPELLADQLARDPARDVLDTLIEVGGSQAGCGCRGCRAEAFARGPQPHAVVRRYRREPSPLVRNMNGSWRTGKLDAVLRGDFDLIAASQT